MQGRMKLPSLQFYPGDWRKDLGVQSLSYEDRGIWWEMCILMHESEERGKLVLNSSPMTNEQVAKCLGLDNQKFNQTLTTLLSSGVASRDTETGAIFCRRMVRDEKTRKIRTECGKKGGNPVLLNQNPTTGVNQNPTPSSSSSSSSSDKGGPTIQIRTSPTMSQAIEYFRNVGADYSESEIRIGWNSFEGTKVSGQWFFGKRPVTDWRAILETRLAENRMRNGQQQKRRVGPNI